jgi:hypothetical protein
MKWHHYSDNLCLERYYIFRKCSVKVSSTVLLHGKLLIRVLYNNALGLLLYFTSQYNPITCIPTSSVLIMIEHCPYKQCTSLAGSKQPADPTFQTAGLRINCQSDIQLKYLCIICTIPYNKSDNYVDLISNNENKIIKSHLKAHNYTQEKLKTTAY